MAINPQKFRKSLIYQASANLEKIYSDLSEIKNIDQQPEKERARIVKMGRQCFGVGFICGILGIVTNSSVPVQAGITPLLFLITLIFGLLGIYYLIEAGIPRRLNLPNYRYELARKVLQMLERDMDKDPVTTLSLDFNSSMQKMKVLETVSHPHRAGWYLKPMQNCWLEVGGELLDKTAFKLTLTELNNVISGYKRSPSGKSKYKSKTKAKGTNFNLELKYSPRKYPAIKLLQDEVQAAIQLPQTATLKRIKVTDKNIFLSVTASTHIATNLEKLYEIVTMMFLSCYQILNLARILSRRS